MRILKIRAPWGARCLCLKAWWDFNFFENRLYTYPNSRIIFVSLLRSSLFIYNFETLALKLPYDYSSIFYSAPTGAQFSYPYKIYTELSSVGATCFKILLLTGGYLLIFHKSSFLQLPLPPQEQQHNDNTIITTILLLSVTLLNYHSRVRYKVLLSYIGVAALWTLQWLGKRIFVNSVFER